MRRLCAVPALVAALMVLPASAAAAASPRGPEPQVVTMWWDGVPHAVDPDCHQDCGEATLVIEARDQNSSISEVVVWLGEGQPLFIAHTWCVQGKQPGATATLRIPGFYSEPGTFTVEVEVYSQARCNWRAPSQVSPVATLETVVTP